MPSFRIFISAVSGELATYCEEVARVLRRTGLEVCDEKHFRQGPATRPEQLRDYIRDCDAGVAMRTSVTSVLSCLNFLAPADGRPG